MLFGIKVSASSAAGSKGEHNRDTDDCAAGFAV